MRVKQTIIVMFTASFLIQYFFMSAVASDRFENITNSYGKAYLSIIMALCMVATEVGMHDHQYDVFSVRSYIAISIALAIFVYLYRMQVAIKDKQYLEEMIEHHSMALLTSKKILEKTDNYKVAKTAKTIIQQQDDQISFMRQVLQEIETKS